MKIIVPLISALFLIGCATVDPDPIRITDEAVPPDAPGPMIVNASGSIFLNLPEDVAEALDLPVPGLEGDIDLKIRGHLIERNPSRSAFTASVMIDLVDPRTGDQLFRFHSDADGEYDGTPTEGIGTALRSITTALQGLTAGDLFRSIPQERSREPTSRHMQPREAGAFHGAWPRRSWKIRDG